MTLARDTLRREPGHAVTGAKAFLSELGRNGYRLAFLALAALYLVCLSVIFWPAR